MKMDMQETESRRYTLPRKKMLKKHTDFQHVYRHAKAFSDRYMVLYVYPSETLGGRVGFAAGKKLGCAAVRSRMKRILREAYRLAQYNIKPEYALILVGRKALIGEKEMTAARALNRLIHRAKIQDKDRTDKI